MIRKMSNNNNMDIFDALHLLEQEKGIDIADLRDGLVNAIAVSIKKTQRRANALKNIIIPGFEDNIHFITNALEEKEREEFTRLKVIKRMF